LLASGAPDGQLCLWEPTRRKLLARTDPASEITRLAWSPDDRQLAVGTVEGVSVFEVTAAETVARPGRRGDYRRADPG
jgi:WD40 repeat protein